MSGRPPPTAQKFDVLCDITRAQHFAWREAVHRVCPSYETRNVVLEMWHLTGEQTGRAYLKRLDHASPLAPQIARGIVWSSECMGEDAVFEAGASPDEAYVRHRGCPWHTWHQRMDLVAEDQPGCDEWFRSTCETIAKATGQQVRVATIESLPEGGSSCLRRIWIDR